VKVVYWIMTNNVAGEKGSESMALQTQRVALVINLSNDIEGTVYAEGKIRLLLHT
jgi:hypothetical protein